MAKVGPRLNIFEKIWKNVIPDARPKPPRPSTAEKITVEEVVDEEEINENVYTSNTQDNNLDSGHKKSSKTKRTETDDKPAPSTSGSGGNVEIHAGGSVINISGSKNIQVGNNYNIGMPATRPVATPSQQTKDDDEDENVDMTYEIKQLMKSKIKPDHEYIDHASQNMGANWKSFFRRQNYRTGKIETFVINNQQFGVAEARYKLFLDWINNADVTLGVMAMRLWDVGEKLVVKDMAEMYENKKNQQ